MGKASKWFRGLLGLKKPDSSQPPTVSSSDVKPPKKKWSFVKSYREKEDQQSLYRQQPRTPVVLVPAGNAEDPSKHAIAVAAATAAVAEVAVAAAHAAAAVVRLTSSARAISAHANSSAAAAASARVTSCGSRNAAAAPPGNVSAGGACYGNREEWAAVMIQSRFRAYLSRKALRALKALVKLQAIVRGRIVRKDNARQKRELLRAHTLPASGRGWLFESPHKAANQIHCLGPPTPEKFEHVALAKSMKSGENLIYRRNGSKNSRFRPDQNFRDEGSNVKTGPRYSDCNDKTLQIDAGKKAHIMPKRRHLFHSSHLSIGSDQYTNSFSTSKDSTAHQTYPSLSSFELQSTSPLKFCGGADEDPFCTAENSPQFHSASSKGGDQRRGPFTPTKSDGSRSCLSGYSDHPNYMSCTESSKAKMRSLSAPKQRPQYERSSSMKRFSIYGYGESRIHPPPHGASSTLRANFASKAYPGSGRLDRLGMPVRDEFTGFSGVHWHRY